MRIDDMMEKAALDHAEVRIVDRTGCIYEGMACGFTKADDEEDGYASIFIDVLDDDGWCLREHEIESIEVVK